MEEKKQKRQFWVIVSIVFLSFLGISMPYLIFPALFLNPNYSILWENASDSSVSIFLGITLAAYPLGQFIGSPILGALSDDYGRKRLLSGSLLISAFCNLLTGMAIQEHQLGLLIMSRFLAGLMEGNIAIARAMVADLTSLPKEGTFGKLNASASIAFILGPFLGGIMTDRNFMESLTLSTPFYVSFFLFLILSGVSWSVLSEGATRSARELRTFWQRINIPNRLIFLFKNKRLKFLLITSTIFTLAVDIFYEFGPVYLTIKWALDPPDLMIYNGILCLALALGNGWLPTYLSSRISKRKSLIVCTGIFSGLLIAMVSTDSPFIIYSIFGICGLLIGLAVTTMTVKISNSVDDQIQGEVMGVQMALRVLGDAIICLFGGALLLISSKFILIFAAGLSIVSMGYYVIKVAQVSTSESASQDLLELK